MRFAFLVLMGLDLAFGGVGGESSTARPEPEVEIANDRRPSLSARIDLGRKFGEAPCPSRPARKTTIREALRPDAKRILIHQYEASDWRDLETVRGYLRRLLDAEPEGGMLSPAVYWAEARPTEIFASVEFANGQRRPLQLANGYAHVQDASGCEWWARYLGPDRSKWVVRP